MRPAGSIIRYRYLFLVIWVSAVLLVTGAGISMVGGFGIMTRAGIVVVAAGTAALFGFFLLNYFYRPLLAATEKPETGAPPPRDVTEEEAAALAEELNILMRRRLSEVGGEDDLIDTDGTGLAEAKLRLKQLREYSIANAITKTPGLILDKEGLSRQILNRAWRISGIETSSIWEADGESYRLLASSGPGTEGRSKEPVPAADLEARGLLEEKGILDCEPIILKADEGTGLKPLLFLESTFLLLQPLVVRDRLHGLIVMESPKPVDLSETRRRFMKALGREAATGLGVVASYVVLREKHLASLSRLSEVIEARHGAAAGHAARVAKIASEIGEAMGLPDASISALKLAAHLHDLGEVGISELILEKRGELTLQERKILEFHPSLGVRLLRTFALTETIEGVILHHHERWDGTGYPEGLKGEEIPLGARILAIAEAFDAMTSDRPYRDLMDFREAGAEIEKTAGKQFDPEIAELFLNKINNWENLPAYLKR